MPLDPLYFSPHEHTSNGDDGTTDLIGTVHTPDEVYLMKRFMAGQDRSQHTLFPESLEDYIAEDNPVRVVDVFVDGLDLAKQGLRASNRKRPVDRPTIPQCYSNSISTGTSIGFNPAGAWNASPSVMSS